ncbi:hypothetical protein ACHQM5_002801 [Ranunculus cassubicifolius]
MMRRTQYGTCQYAALEIANYEQVGKRNYSRNGLKVLNILSILRDYMESLSGGGVSIEVQGSGNPISRVR